MDGWSVLAELKADPETAEIPVILVLMLDDLKAGNALGASEFMVKPVDRERLTRKVEPSHRGSSSRRSSTRLRRRHLCTFSTPVVASAFTG